MFAELECRITNQKEENMLLKNFFVFQFPARFCYKGREHEQTGFSLLNSGWKKIQLEMKIVFSTVSEMRSLAAWCRTFLFTELIDILASDAEI